MQKYKIAGKEKRGDKRNKVKKWNSGTVEYQLPITGY